MKYCGNCGESVANSTSKFCSNCFQRIEPSMQPPPVREVPPVEQTSTDVEGGQRVSAIGEVVEGEQLSATEEVVEGGQFSATEEVVDEYPTEDTKASEQFFNTYQSNETEDISKAFYTSDTGTILPVNRLDTTGESRPKKTFLIPLFIGVGVIAALAITIGLVISGAFASPVDRFIAIQRDHVINPYIAAVKEVEEVPISTDFTITASADTLGGGLETLAMLSILEQLTLEVGFDMSSDMTESLMELNLSLLGEELLSTVITIDEDYVGFYFPTIDGNYYIIDLESLGGGGLNLGFPVPDVTSEEMIDLVETYSDIILSIVHSDNLEVNRETISLFNGREELNARVYTLTPTEEDFAQLLGALIEEFREDEFIYQIFAAQFDDPWLLMFMGYANTAEAWQGILDEMEKEIDDLAFDMADSGVTWRVATYRRQMILQEFYIPNVGYFRYEGFLGSGGHRTDWFTLHVEEDDILLTVQNDMTASSQSADGYLFFSFSQNPNRPNDFSVFDVVISYDIDFTTTSILDFPYGTYELEIKVDDNSFTGSLIVKEGVGGGSNHILSLYDITALQLSRLTLNIHTTDEPSNVQAPTVQPIDLSNMSYLELMMTLSGLMAELEELFSILEQL